MTGPRVLPVGERALLVEVPPGEVPAWAAVLSGLRERGGATDVVPGAGTVLLDGLRDPVATAAWIGGVVPPVLPATSGPLVELGMVADGPDLAVVADAWGTDVPGVLRVLTATTFRVAFTGFVPGFGYLSGLPAGLTTPRRASPRTRVPAGSVALAGEWAGVYPRESPGGWQLVGRTETPLFDPAADPPALLRPGVRVRFRPAATG